MKILDWRNLGHKGPADPAQAPPLKSQSIGLALSPAPLLQLQGCLATLCSCPCTWAKLGKPLQETECLASHYHHTCCSPCCYFHQNAMKSLKSTFCDKSAMFFIMEGMLYNPISQGMHAFTLVLNLIDTSFSLFHSFPATFLS